MRNHLLRSLALIVTCLLAGYNISSATTYYTKASGAWNASTTWSTVGCGNATNSGTFPGAADNVIICGGHTVTISTSAACATLTVNASGALTWSANSTLTVSGAVTVDGSITTVNTGGSAATTVLQANSSVTINNGGSITNNGQFNMAAGQSFTINNGGTYTHNPENNDAANVTMFSNATESFGITSNLVINEWYDGTVPLANNMTGNYGNITINAAIGGAWNQNGKFSVNLIMGTLTINNQAFNFDTGAGASTSLALQDLVINGVSNVSMRSGAAPSGGTYTLTTKNVSLNGSSSKLYMSQNVSMTFNWTATGNVFLQGDFFVTSGGAAYTNVSNVNITGNLTIDMALATTRFDINYFANNASSATLTVGGTTTIQGSPGWVHMVDGGTGSLNFTTANLVVTGGADNYFNMSTTGNSTINITGNVTVSGASTQLGFLGEYQGTSLFGAMVFTTNVSGSATVTIGGNVTMSSGIFFGVAYSSTGSLTWTQSGTFSQTAGDFYGLGGSADNTSGNVSMNVNAINFDGGSMIFHNGHSNTSNKTCSVTVTNNFDINFTAATDNVILINIISSGAAVNNTVISDLNVGGNFIVSGNSAGAFFITSPSTTAETNDITGNMTISGGDVYFNGTEGAGNGHTTTTNIGGSVTVSGGKLRFSARNGAATINVTGNTTISGGEASVKVLDGAATMTITGFYSQTGGTFYLHKATADVTPNVVSVIVNGDFTNTGGTLNFDGGAGANASQTHTLTLNGANYTVGGTGIITHANYATANTVFGQIYFARAGTITGSRTSTTHEIRQVKQTVNSGCTLNFSGSANDMQITSHVTQATIANTALIVNGVLDMGTKKILGLAVGTNDYYSGMTVSSAARLRTANTAGFYDGTTSACLQPKPYTSSANYRMDYFLDPNSTVEYYASANQVVTGKYPSGLTSVADINSSTSAQYKYGILDINNQGTLGTNYAYPAIPVVPAVGNGNVFVRTTLLLTRGELNLAGSGTGQTIYIENGAASAIDRNGSTTNGYIKSEETNGGDNRAKVQWNMGTVTGSHVFPFGYTTGASNYVPFTFNKTTAGAANITVSTRFSGTNNQPWAAASSVAAVANMYSAIINGDGSVQAVIDRWWDINTSAAVAADLIFTYRGVENTMSATYQTGTLGAQHWNGSSWDPPVGTGTGVTSGTGTVSVSGASTFSPWVISSLAAPLPIEIIYFDASCQDDDVLIKWGTATETNNDYFTVERSYDGINFEAVATVNGAGTSTTNRSYSIVDHNYTSERGYYRLKQTDFNGLSTYSPLISIGSCSDKEDVMYAVVNNEGINVVFSSVQGDEYTLSLYDVTGRKLMEQRTVAEEGVNIVKLPAGTLGQGMYLLSLHNSARTVTTKLVVH